MTPVKTSASVIIPTYNRKSLLAKTLAGLVNSTVPAKEFEVIVVDDGSSDGSVSVITEFEDALDLKYIYQADRGFRAARARNLGLRLAESPVSILLDCGVVPAPEFVDFHLRAHTGQGDRICIGYVLGFENTSEKDVQLGSLLEGPDIDANLSRVMQHPEHRDIRESCYALCDDDLDSLPAPWAVAWTCNLSLPTALAQQVGGFDEYFQSWGAEDLDFTLTLHKAGYRFVLGRGALAVHYPHRKSFEENVRSSRKNKVYLHTKHALPETELLLSTQAVDLNAALFQKMAR